MDSSNTKMPTIKGAWDNDRIVRVLGNAMARKAMAGQLEQPIAEKALASVQAVAK